MARLRRTLDKPSRERPRGERSERHLMACFEQVEGLRREIRLPRGQGVAGAVALSGKFVHIKDGEEAKQVLGDTSDKLTGGVVKSMLCCGVVGSQGSIIAVLQAFHAKPRAFQPVHERLMHLYSHLVRSHARPRQT